mmetsp:Transcript_3979/g.8061  ORF Transcript_3979/g.8061 Transcript_3979/m.8061 type:complete len:253 (-) Transcript_3979:226-984(-)
MSHMQACPRCSAEGWPPPTVHSVFRWSCWLRFSDGKVSYYPHFASTMAPGHTRLASSLSLSTSASMGGTTRLGSSLSPFGNLASSASSWFGNYRIGSSVSRCSLSMSSWRSMVHSVADSHLGSLGSSLSCNGCLFQDVSSPKAVGSSIIDSFLAVKVCRSAYLKAGETYLDTLLEGNCRLVFDEVHGNGGDIVQVLEAPLMMRRQCISRLSQDVDLPLAAELLFEALCRTAEPIWSRYFRLVYAVASEMSNS